MAENRVAVTKVADNTRAENTEAGDFLPRVEGGLTMIRA